MHVHGTQETVLCQCFRNEKGVLMRAQKTLCGRTFVYVDCASLSEE